MRTTLIPVGLLLGLLLGTPASATPILTGGTDPSSGSISADFMSGFEFVSTIDQSLTALGLWDFGSDGLSLSYRVGLWDNTTQALLASAIIDNSDPLDTSLTVSGGQWRYETLSSAIALTATRTYTIAFQTQMGLTLADSLLLTYSTLATAPTVTVPAVQRFLSTTSFVFPTSTFAPTIASFVGQVNAQLAPTASPVPEPTSLILLGTGLVGAGVRRYRRRQ